MRDLMILAGMLTLVPLALANAFAAYLLWGWTGLVAIDNYVYGFMASVRMNLIFALITIGVMFLGRDKEKAPWQLTRTSALLIALLVQATLSAIFAYEGNPLNWELYEKLAKTLLFVILMPMVVTRRYRIHAMIVMICLGLGFHGLIDGLKFFSSGGAHLVQGFRKFGDNNHFAVVLVMVIPLLLYVSNYASSRMVRLAAFGGMLLTISAVIGTRSRGGFISLAAVGLWLVLTSRRKTAGLVLFMAGIAVIVALAPESWTERMETIKSAEGDSSFMQRVEAWQVSSAVALKNPLMGGGFHSVQIQSVWERFRGNTGLLGFVSTGTPSQIFRAAHSIYFEVLGDLGFFGFFIFLAILINAIVTGFEVRRMASADTGLEWAADLARALAAVVFAFMIGGGGVSLAYSEAIYMVVVLMEIIKQQVLVGVANRPLAGTGASHA